MEILRVKLNYPKIKQLIGKKSVVTKRPILQTINYTEEYLEFTDSYSLVRFYTKNKVTGLFNINDLLFNLEGIYPSTQSLLDRIKINENILSDNLIIINDNIYYQFNNNTNIIFDKKLIDLTLATLSLKFEDLKHLFKLANEYNALYLKTERIEIFILGIIKGVNNHGKNL